MRLVAVLFLVMALLSLASPIAEAHFKLLAPQSWITENNLGDPQKLGPCGGTSADAGMPTNFINIIQGGQKLHLKLQETVFHPGHYRVALAVNSRTELPEDSQVITKESARGPQSVSAAIDKQPKMPVLADGLFQHTARMNDPWETDIDIPNINCPKCTLQIVEFMAEHGLNKDGGYFYHHCADLQITADPAKPIDRRWPTAR
jgi:hypothetical protein